MPSYSYYLNNETNAQNQISSLSFASDFLGGAVGIAARYGVETALFENMEFAALKGLDNSWWQKNVVSRVGGAKGLNALDDLGLDTVFKKKANINMFGRNRFARQAAKVVKQRALQEGMIVPERLFFGENSMVKFLKNMYGKGGYVSQGGTKQVLGTAVLGQSVSSVINAFQIYGMVELAFTLGKGAYDYFSSLGSYARYKKATYVDEGVPVARLEEFVDSKAASSMREVALNALVQSREQYMMQQQNEAQIVSENPYRFYRYMGV